MSDEQYTGQPKGEPEGEVDSNPIDKRARERALRKRNPTESLLVPENFDANFQLGLNNLVKDTLEGNFDPQDKLERSDTVLLRASHVFRSSIIRIQKPREFFEFTQGEKGCSKDQAINAVQNTFGATREVFLRTIGKESLDELTPEEQEKWLNVESMELESWDSYDLQVISRDGNHRK